MRLDYPSGHLKPSRHLSSSKWGVQYVPALVMTARPGESEGWCRNLQTGTERPGAARRHQQRSCCVGRRPKNCGPECRAQPAHSQCCLATVALDTLVRRRCIHCNQNTGSDCGTRSPTILAEAGASTAAGAHLLLHKRLVCSEKAAKGSSVQVPQGVPLLWRGGPVRSRLGHTHLLTCRPPIRPCQDWACRGAKQARPYQSISRQQAFQDLLRGLLDSQL